MNKIALTIGFMATMMICSCGSSSNKTEEAGVQVPLLVVKDGDTVEVSRPITAEDITPILYDGYQFAESSDFGFFIKNAGQDRDKLMETDMMAVVKTIASNMDIDHEFAFDRSKIVDGSEGDFLVDTYYCVYPLDKFLVVGFIDAKKPYIGRYTFLEKDEAESVGEELMKKSGKDFSQEQMQMMAALAFILKQKEGPYFAAINFDSESGISTRMYTLCVPEK